MPYHQSNTYSSCNGKVAQIKPTKQCGIEIELIPLSEMLSEDAWKTLLKI